MTEPPLYRVVPDVIIKSGQQLITLCVDSLCQSYPPFIPLHCTMLFFFYSFETLSCLPPLTRPCERLWLYDDRLKMDQHSFVYLYALFDVKKIISCDYTWWGLLETSLLQYLICINFDFFIVYFPFILCIYSIGIV